MTDHIGAFDRLYSKLASFDNVAISIANFSSLTAQAITISKTTPLLNITDQASLNTFSLGVAGISGDFFTDSQSGDIIMKSQSPTKRLLLGSGPTTDVILDNLLTPRVQNRVIISTTFADRVLNFDNPGTAACQIVMPNAPGAIFTETAANDLVIYSERGRVYIATDDTTGAGVQIGRSSKVTSIQGSTVVLGPNIYPPNTGTPGQILTSNGSGTLSWTSPIGTGSVTSVALSTPSFLTVSGSPITSSGTLTISATSTGTGSVVLGTNPVLSGTTLNGTTTVTGALVGNTGGDFTISTPNNFFFLNAAYSVRSGGLAIHQEASNNQTFPGTLTGDQTLRSDSNVWLGTDVAAKTVNLRAPAGIFAGNRRLDLSNFGIYEGASPLPDSSWNPYIPPNQLQTIGTPLSFNNTNGRFTNQTGFRVLVTASYSFKRESNGFGQTLFRIALDNGFFVARNTVAALDEATGSFQFILNDQDGFVFQGFQNSGSGNNFASSCIVSYTYVVT